MLHPTVRGWSAALFVASAIGVAGCAGYSYSPQGLPPGTPEPDVVRLMGPPTGQYVLPDGNTRLEFARGPAGQQTYMVDFTPDGAMIGWHQALELWRFYEIMPGMSADEVLMRVGHPGVTFPIGRQRLIIWNYRYPTNDCLWYQISISIDDNKVVAGGQGIDPRCDAPSDARH